jgi:hypothetical protein
MNYAVQSSEGKSKTECLIIEEQFSKDSLFEHDKWVVET